MFCCRLCGFRRCIRTAKGLMSRIVDVTATFSQPRNFTVTSMTRLKSMKVAVLGAAGQTGTWLSLLLKQSSLIDELALYDNKGVLTALQLELSHIDTRCRLSSSTSGAEGLKDTLEDAKIVIITADQTCVKEENANDVAVTNANILSEYVPSVITYCPKVSQVSEL